VTNNRYIRIQSKEKMTFPPPEKGGKGSFTASFREQKVAHWYEFLKSTLR